MSDIITKVIERKIFYTILACYFIIQLLLILLVRPPFFSDSLNYLNLAQSSIAHNTFYPSIYNLYDDYIIAPVYVNYLIVLLRIYDSTFMILLSNVFLNSIQLLLLVKISTLIFGDEISGRIAGLIYIVYLASLGAVLMNLTELFFGVVTLSGFYFYLKGGKYNFILAGTFIALSIGIRQIGSGLLFAILINELVAWFNSKKANKNLLAMIVSTVIVLTAFGLYSKYTTGYFMVSGNNVAVNVLMGAYDDANGSFKADVLQKGGPGFIPESVRLNYIEKSNYWNKKSVEWFEKHPAKWISILPLKLLHMFAFDDWSVFTLANTTQINMYRIIKSVSSGKSLSELFSGRSAIYIAWFILLYTMYHIVYYFLLFWIVKAVYNFIRTKDWANIKLLIIPYVFSFFGIAATLIAVGSARYKYPFMIMLILTLVPGIIKRIKKIPS